MEKIKIELFDTIKKFNKTMANNYSNYKKINANDLILCRYLYKNEKNNLITQVKDLSEYMGISRPAVNTILNRLEEREIIERYRLKEDRKSVFVKLTKKAYNLYELEKEKLSVFMQKLINGLGEDDTKKLIELLEKVNNIMEEEVR
jgi:DNA-binding MarR family transcriptional regulator